jgi:glycosyltransferase involved in cell wall biosynthesis
MLIGFDGSRAFVQGRTGTENYSYQLLLHLAKIDRVNNYFVYIRPNSSVILNASEGSPTNVGTQGISDKLRDSSPLAQNDSYQWPKNFKFKVINYKRLWTQVGLSLQTFKDPLDILFVPAHTLPLLKKPSLKTVMTVHDLGAEYLPQMHQLKQRLYLNWMTHHQLKSATKLIAVSQATKKDLVKRARIDPKKVEVIYEGVNFEVFKKVKADILVNILSKFDINKGKYFLFVGTIQPRKNLERLIEAFSKLKEGDQRLVLVGGKGWLSEAIYQAPQKFGVEDKVKFLGRVSDEELAALYSGAKALTYPSLFEGFGLPILEAQACECPVITSKISSMPEVAGPPAGGGAILVDPYNLEEIIKAMQQVQDKRPALIKKGLENVRQFSWEKAALETLELFKSL